MIILIELYTECCDFSSIRYSNNISSLGQLLCASYDLNLPRFPNLTRLAIGIGVGIGWKRLMTKFVKCSPNLNVLTLDNKVSSAHFMDFTKHLILRFLQKNHKKLDLISFYFFSTARNYQGLEGTAKEPVCTHA